MLVFRNLLVIIALFSCNNSVYGQVAFGMEVEIKPYQWYNNPQTPTSDYGSSGQVFTFTSIGPKVWFGDWYDWTISLEGKADYSPFSMGFDYKGMGAIAFPFVVAFNYDSSGDNGTTKTGIGGGVQWTRTDLYARSGPYKNHRSSFFLTYILELSIQLSVGDKKEGATSALFIRGGFGEYNAATIGAGLKFSFRNITW